MAPAVTRNGSSTRLSRGRRALSSAKRGSRRWRDPAWIANVAVMLYRLAADAVLVFHLGFVLFVAIGALLVLRWPRLAWLHIPIALYGATIELVGFICPLTPLENWLRHR